MGTTPNGSHKLHTKSHHLTTNLTIKSHHLNISPSQHNKKWNIFYI